jgi:hypothetical protein
MVFVEAQLPTYSPLHALPSGDSYWSSSPDLAKFCWRLKSRWYGYKSIRQVDARGIVLMRNQESGAGDGLSIRI